MTSINNVLAIVGMPGTGKSVATNFIAKKYNYKRIYFGGYILKEVEEQGLAINQINEKQVRENLRKDNGLEVVAKLCYPDIENYLNNQFNVIIDGLYSYSEYKYLKNKLGEKLILIGIYSDKLIRYERLCEREIRPLTRLEVDLRDDAEILNLEKGGPIAISDFHLINNETVNKLETDIEIIFKTNNYE